MKAYAWAVAAAGWGLLLVLLVQTPPPGPALFGIFLLLAIIGEWLMVPLPRGGYQSTGLIVAAAALLLMGPPATALTSAIGVVVGNGLLHRRPYLTSVFNSGQYIIASLVAGLVFTALDPGAAATLRTPLFTGRTDPPFLLAFLAAIVAYAVTSSLFVSGMIALRKSARFTTVVRDNITWELVNDLAFATLGLILSLIAIRALPAGTIVLTAPLFLVGYILMLYTTREQAHRQMEIVERIGRASMSLDLEELFQTMYDEIRKVMSADAFYVAVAEAGTLVFEFLIDCGRRFPRQPYDQGDALREILERRQPLLINRTREELAQPDTFARVGYVDRRSASLMFVPVTRSELVIGVISVQSYTHSAYTDSDLRLLAAIAGQVGAAIENARLFQAGRRNIERLTTLQALSTAIAGSLEMEKLLPALADGARQALGVDRCATYLIGEQGLSDVYAHGFPPGFPATMRQVMQGRVGPVPMDMGQPHVIEDAASDAAFQALREAAYGGAWSIVAPLFEGVRTVATLPLLYHEELLGVLVFYHEKVRPYTPDDLRLAQAVANQAALAVKNATLLAQAQHRAAEVDLVNRLYSTVSGTLNPEELFRRIVEEVASRFGYSHVSIYRRQGEYLFLQAQIGYRTVHGQIPVKKGVMGRVVRSAQPVVLSDVTLDPDYTPVDPAVHSEVAVPIVIDDEVRGVLNVEATAERTLGEGDLQLLQTLARQLSVALRNATLHDEVKRARDELSVLYDAAKAISSTLEIESVLENIVQVTCRAFGYEYGAILLSDERSGDLIIEATYGYPPGTGGYRVPSGKGITGWVQRTGKPEIVADVHQDGRYIGVDERVASEVAVPLISEGRVIGVFNIESTRPAALGERDLNILTTLAGYATIAIQNARLFEQTKQLAITDGLTGLFNHRYLHQALDCTLQRCSSDGQPVALIMLEIDNFKRYNDTYGHQRGDEVLHIVADLLRKGSRSTDLVARYGGDEFMLVLPSTPKHMAAEVADRLRRAVGSYPFLLGENILTTVTLSAGVAASPEDGETVDGLVDAVDRAQYTAKRSGGNKVQLAQVYEMTPKSEESRLADRG